MLRIRIQDDTPPQSPPESQPEGAPVPGEGISELLDLETLVAYFDAAVQWLNDNVLTWFVLVQLGLVAVTGLAAAIIAPRIVRIIATRLPETRLLTFLKPLGNAVAEAAIPGLWLILLGISTVVATSFGQASGWLDAAISLITAFVVILLLSRFIRDKLISNIVFFAAWAVAALDILGLLKPMVDALDALAVPIGEQSLSALDVFKGLIALGLLLVGASVLARFLQNRIMNMERLNPSLQVLFSKLVTFLLMIVAVLMALTIIGIDLTALLVFSSALGVGIGLGLQGAAANIISGIMLLLDKSIKPGDTITIDDTFGWVTQMGGRFVGLRTRDGIEHLIPNEVFIREGVQNWSYSSNAVRLKIPVGISYNSDPRKAIDLCLEAANEVERVVADPEPRCLVKGFGDSSVDLEIRIWITDPHEGVSNVKSEVLLGVWDRFHEHGIAIPFPQRDLHVVGPVQVDMRKDASNEDAPSR